MAHHPKMRTAELVSAALCTAMIAVCAQISIPLPGGVPVTLQTFAVALCGFLLTPKLAALSVTVYLLLGALGLPVFSGFQGGAASLFGKTGGFLIGFLALAVFSSLSRKKLPSIGFALLGLLITHLLGIIQLMVIAHLPFLLTAMTYSVPFLVKDVVSIGLAFLVAVRLRPALQTHFQ